MILIKFVYIWRTEFARMYYTNTGGGGGVRMRLRKCQSQIGHIMLTGLPFLPLYQKPNQKTLLIQGKLLKLDG